MFRNYFILIIISFIIFMNCSKNKENKIIIEKQSNLDCLIYKKSYIINKKSLLNSPLDFVIDKDSLFYFSDIYSRKIYRTKRPFLTYEQVGRNGQGPFEYIMPFNLYIYNDKLFFSDISNGFLKYNYMNKGKNKVENLTRYFIKGAKKFVIDNDYIYTINTFNNPRLNIYSKANGTLIDSLINIDHFYYKINLKVEGGNLVKDNSGTIYLSCLAPYIIFKVKKMNGKFNVINKWNFEKSDDFIPWTKEKDNELKRIHKREKKWEILNSCTRVEDLYLIKNEKNQYLISYLTSGTDIENELNIYQIITLEGEIIKIFRSKNLKLIGVYKDKLFFIRKDIKNNYLEEYTIKL